MDKEVRKNRPAFRGRDAAMLGGIAGGVWGANSPLKIPYTIGELVDTNIRNNPSIPYDLEDAAIMSSGGYTALTGAGMGALGGAAAYQLLRGLGKGAARAYKAGKKAYENHKAEKEASDNFSEGPKTGKMNPKVKKALKVAGAIGAAGALGTAGAIAGDALNLWDLGEVEGVAGKVLSPLDKAGNALNKMASAPALEELNKARSDLKWANIDLRKSGERYQDLVDDLVKIGKAYERGEKVSLDSFEGLGGTSGFRVAAEGPEKVSRYLYSSNVPVK